MVTQRWIVVSLLFVLSLSPTVPVLAQTVTAYVDRNPIQLEETVQFVVRFNGGNPGGAPDLSSLENDFDLLGTAQSTQTSIINGRSNTVTQWVSTLAPKRAGAITIHPIRVGSNSSAPLTLTVLSSGKPGQPGKGRDLFIHVQVEPQDPYVQSQVTYTVKLYHAVPIREGRLDEPNSTDVLTKKLGEDRSFDTVLDGRRYQVIERQYALFPQKSGEIIIPPITLTGQVPEKRSRRSRFDDMMGNRPRMFGNDPFDALFQTTRAVRTRSERVTLNVRPRPLSFTGNQWFPAQEVVLQETWTPEIVDQQALRTGEPITRTLTMVAKGVTGEQLPDFPVTKIDNIKIYPDQPVTDTKVEGASTIGIRQRKSAFVPTESGTVQLPAIHIPWWDLTTNQARVASLPARTLKIVPEPGNVEPTSPPGVSIPLTLGSTNPTAGGPVPSMNESPNTVTVANTSAGSLSRWWQAGIGVLSLLWLVTCLGWWYDRRTRGRQGNSKKSETDLSQDRNLKQARAAFAKACRANHPKEAKDTLLQWAAKKWPVNPPLGLASVAHRLADTQGQAAVWELDRLLYAETESVWNGKDCCQKISFAMDIQEKQGSIREETLPPLYLTGT